MTKQFISIQDASELSKKSIQTIRRAIKSKKLKHKRLKTPQGFNYLVNYQSLCEIYRIKPEPDVKKEVTEALKIEKAVKKTNVNSSKGVFVDAEDFKHFTSTLEKMVIQHSEERQNFIRLVDTLQEKVFVLENQLNLLKSPEKRWYQLWK